MGPQTRRDFLKTSVIGVAAAAVGGNSVHAAKREFDISLAGWSLHRSIGKASGKIPMLDMPRLAREEFGIGAIELVNTMLASTESDYVKELIKRAEQYKVAIKLIMIDGQGSIGADNEEGREIAITNHKKWIDMAAEMACHSIRMNWVGASKDVMSDESEIDAFIKRSVGPFRKLCDYGDSKGLFVIIENHGGPSSYPAVMERLMKAVDHPRFGTLPDFGNFPADVDIYDAIDRLMVFAKMAVSAKCYDFDDTTGDETKLDYPRLVSNVVDKHGYHGCIGIEYEGNRLSEFDGIKACKKLLDKLRG